MNTKHTFRRFAALSVALFSITHICVTQARAAFPTNTYSKTLTLSQLRADDSFKDFKAKMTGFEDLVVTLTYDQSIAGYYGLVKVKQSGGTNVYYIANTDDVTVSGSSLSFTLARTNSIPNGTHDVDVAIISSTSTNLVRCGGQGKLAVRNSLFDDADGTWQSPSLTNLVDYLTKTEASTTYVATNGNTATISSPTAHRLFYSDGSSVIQELAYGTSNQVLTSQGASAAPTWTAAGSGDITAVTVSGGILSGGAASGDADVALTTNVLNQAVTNSPALGGVAAASWATDAEVTSATGALHTTVSAEIDGDITTHAGAADPHGDRAYSDGLVDDLSGVTDAAGARTNLGLVAGGAGDVWVEKDGDTMTGGLDMSSGIISNVIRVSATDQASLGSNLTMRAGDYSGLYSGTPATITLEGESNDGGDITISAGGQYAGSDTAGNIILNAGGEVTGGGTYGFVKVNQGNLNMGGNAITNAAYEIQTAPYALTSAATVTVSEAWTTNRFWLDMTNNVTLEVSNVDTNKAADWVLDVRMNNHTLTFGSTITNLTTAANFTRTNSFQSIVGNRPIYETITEVW